MDIVLDLTNTYIVDPYLLPNPTNEWLQKESWSRMLITLSVVVVLGGYALYFLFATLSYFFLWDRSIAKSPRYLKNQIKREITMASLSLPLMGLLTVPIFVMEVKGYSKLYDEVDEYGVPFLLCSLFTFLLFTDFGIYWIHRGLHLPWFYARLHKPHHRWLVTTPFASHAFHPVDGFAQSIPYHIYVFLFPMHKWAYLGMFVFVNFWTISIHDGNFRVPSFLVDIVNGAAHHADHHAYFNYNYGQFFTLWDRIGGSHRMPKFYTAKAA